MISLRVTSKLALLVSKLNQAGYAIQPIAGSATPLSELVTQCSLDGGNINHLTVGL